MKCPFCGSLEDKVLESRQNTSGTTIRRRRECLSCSYRFTSYEKIEEIVIQVIKRDGTRQIYEQNKMLRGLKRAIEKRPVSQMALEDQIALHSKGSNEIQSSQIGQMLMDQLFELDKVAYVRFASVYGHFEEVEEFIKVIEDMTNHKKKPKRGKEKS
jgi:transcriptional repressor NrdR